MAITKQSWKSNNVYTLWEHYTCFHQQDNLDNLDQYLQAKPVI